MKFLGFRKHRGLHWRYRPYVVVFWMALCLLFATVITVHIPDALVSGQVFEGGADRAAEPGWYYFQLALTLLFVPLLLFAAHRDWKYLRLIDRRARRTNGPLAPPVSAMPPASELRRLRRSRFAAFRDNGCSHV